MHIKSLLINNIYINLSRGIFVMDKKEKAKQIKERVEKIIAMESSETDPNGSYTGVPLRSDEKPVQDVDDL